MNDLIKIAADDISKLRKDDVFLVLEQNDESVRYALAGYICERRPDLENEVLECLKEL